ncbi:phage antirepressor KilAC domain-containing protein, partial [Escherichia coli]
PNKLFAWMRDHKILIASGARRNVPMQEYMDRGYFTVKETAVNKASGEFRRQLSDDNNAVSLTLFAFEYIHACEFVRANCL